MLSPKLLTANIAELTKAQGRCPTLGAMPGSMRVAVIGSDVQVELHTEGDGWQIVDSPAAPDVPPDWLPASVAAGQVIVVGAGVGHVLDALATLGVRKIIAIEPHPGLATLLLSRRNWRDWIAKGRFRLLTGPDYTGAADVARTLDGLQDIAVVSHPLRERWEPAAMARATAVAQRVAQNARANGNARRRFAAPYLLHTLANLGAVAREADVRALDGAFAGIPAVVAGAGPSLDDSMSALAELQDRALIVAADTAFGPLLGGGVRPHLVVAVDSSPLNARHLTTPEQADDVALACEASVDRTAIARFRGRTFVFKVANHDPWPWLHDAGISRGEVKTWGSVLTSAFDLARRFGCDPIVFVGADMAYTGMRPYCRGTIYDAIWQEWIDRGCTWEALMADYFSRQPEMWHPDVHGAPVRTAPHLVSYRDWLVEQASTAKVRVVNASGGGILHGGRIELCTLHDVLAVQPARPDLRDILRTRYSRSIERSADAERLAALLRKARSSRATLPMDRWVAFTVGTATPDAIEAALSDASG